MIDRRTALWILALALVPGCGKETEEKKILRLFKEGAEAAEAGKVRGVTDLLADDFRDADGNDKDLVKGVLVAQVLRGGKISIYRRNESVAVTGETATASFDALLARGDRKGLAGAIPTDGAAYRFKLELKKVDGDWKVSSGSWAEIDPKDFLLGK